jgi:hypothetical protein
VSGHEHVFRRAALRHADGTEIPGGRRCACGLEVVGEGPLAVSAAVVRTARQFNEAWAGAAVQVARAMEPVRAAFEHDAARLGAALEADRRRRFP